MEVLSPRCAGLDVYATTVVACVRIASGATVTYEHRTVSTHTRGLLELVERLEMYRGGWTNELDFYWMVQLDGQLRWVTPDGLSETPGRLARVAPYAYGTTLIDQAFPPGTVLVNALFAVDGLRILGYDVITAVVIAPPTP